MDVIKLRFPDYTPEKIEKVRPNARRFLRVSGGARTKSQARGVKREIADGQACCQGRQAVTVVALGAYVADKVGEGGGFCTA